ncbi:MAG: hypothetical protein HOJ54_10330 [Phycisphaerae bacterium]|nr:hypothetical protein [Phycisphaerae bacterium]
MDRLLGATILLSNRESPEYCFLVTAEPSRRVLTWEALNTLAAKSIMMGKPLMILY